jgi:hypothetical protein
MSTLLHRFDSTDRFPLLESWTTTRSPVTLRVDRGGIREGQTDTGGGGLADAQPDDPPVAGGRSPFLRIALRRADDDPPEMIAVIALPLLAIDGNPTQLQLDVLGDASGCHLFIEAGDAVGAGFAYDLGSVDFVGWQTCRAEVARPAECWAAPGGGAPSVFTPPLQPYRLGLTAGASCSRVDLGLAELRVSGEVRIALPGVA